MSDINRFHPEVTGTLSPPRPPTPKDRKAASQARNSFAGILIGGAVMILLTIAYIVALFKKLDDAQNILVVIGSSLSLFVINRNNDRKDSDT
jgi:hypothetical protein